MGPFLNLLMGLLKRGLVQRVYVLKGPLAEGLGAKSLPF